MAEPHNPNSSKLHNLDMYNLWASVHRPRWLTIDVGFEVAVAVDDDDFADVDCIGEVLEGYVDNGVIGKDPFVDDLIC